MSMAELGLVRAAAPRAAPAPRTATNPARGWLLSPWLDRLVVANLAWPLLALLVTLAWADGPLGFAQLYFISSPHRWITLVLVFGDRTKFRAQPARFATVGVALLVAGAALVALSPLHPRAASSLTLLMMLDYVWNAWHFGAQHGGIARIYGRTSGVEMSEAEIAFEKQAIRALVLWVFLRLAVSTGVDGPYGTDLGALGHWIGWLDPVLVVPALVVLAREWRRAPRSVGGRLPYLTSAIAIYLAQLAAIRSGADGLAAALFFAAAVFHAGEYLAICHWATRKKTEGAWKHPAARGASGVLAFMAVVGVANAVVGTHWASAWALLTLLVSLLHYGYDGMIWRSPKKPSPARAG
jgi:hypothetical protein